jgi:hyperosmotically inducible protein
MVPRDCKRTIDAWAWALHACDPDKGETHMSSRLLGTIGLVIFAVGCSQSDPGITTSVKTQLAADPIVKARRIDVDTRDRVVTLTGEVNSAEERTQALAIARGTKGVANVVDRLSVVPEAAPTTGFTTDAGITAEVKGKLLADPDIGGLRIDVDTKDHVVTLTGTVKTEAERSKAVQAAREVEGVTSVTDQLTVTAGRY